jgi:hypothetical protein
MEDEPDSAASTQIEADMPDRAHQVLGNEFVSAEKEGGSNVAFPEAMNISPFNAAGEDAGPESSRTAAAQQAAQSQSQKGKEADAERPHPAEEPAQRGFEDAMVLFTGERASMINGVQEDTELNVMEVREDASVRLPCLNAPKRALVEPLTPPPIPKYLQVIS